MSGIWPDFIYPPTGSTTVVDRAGLDLVSISDQVELTATETLDQLVLATLPLNQLTTLDDPIPLEVLAALGINLSEVC